MSESYDLLICVRCHAMRDFVLDTVDAVKKYTSRQTTKVVCAVDGNRKLARDLKRRLPGAVYCSGTRWGWGAGLYGLLAGSILWAEERFQFSHFLSIDYDTLFIGKYADTMLLNTITSPELGLIGHYNSRNEHWRVVFEQERLRIRQRFGDIPRSYRPGEGVQGGCMLLTRSLLNEMRARRMFVAPFAVAKEFTTIADDHLLPLFCRMCGLEIGELGGKTRLRWHLDCNPVGLEKKKIKIFHPTKIRPECKDRAVELRTRNYYRERRGREPLV